MVSNCHGRYLVTALDGRTLYTDDPAQAVELAAANRRAGTVTCRTGVAVMPATVAARAACAAQLDRARTGEPTVLRGRPAGSGRSGRRLS